MRSLAHTLFLMAGLLIVIVAPAQDYVISLKNDTLRGKVQMMNYDLIDRIELTDANKKKMKFTAVQVREVGMKEHIYRPIKTDYGYRMAQLEKPGFLALYLAQSPKGTSYEIQWLVKRDGSAIEVPNLSFKKIMSDFLSDCPEVSDKIKKETLHKKELMTIIDQYNSCMESHNAIIPAATSVAVTQTSEAEGTLLSDLTKLQKEISTDTSLPSKNDITDLLNDMIQKVREQKPVPKYQLDSFEGVLKGTAYEEKATGIASRLRK